MKVLCLHGQGTSGAIFKSQTAAFRSKLGPSYTFDFVDAPFPCPPAPGIKVMYSTGTYTWWPQATVSLIRGSHQRLLDHISENGPYDALCCFSQGCSLAFSFLLYHARECPEDPLPFRSVIFICGGIPFSVLEDLGYRVSERAYEVNDQTVRVMKSKAARLAHMARNLDEIRVGVGLWDDTSDLIHDPTQIPDEGGDVFGIDFGEVPQDMRIRGVQTVHVFGGKDPRWPSSMQLAYFCEQREMFDHGGGHDIPRSTEVSERIAELVRGLPGGEKGL